MGEGLLVGWWLFMGGGWPSMAFAASARAWVAASRDAARRRIRVLLAGMSVMSGGSGGQEGASPLMAPSIWISLGSYRGRWKGGW
jgi:hypothetical protein